LPWKTIELHNILRLCPQIEGAIRRVKILGYDEDNRVILFFYLWMPVSTQFNLCECNPENLVKLLISVTSKATLLSQVPIHQVIDHP
jgi:hypothetical protein